MASVRNLKKDIHYVFGDILEAIYIHEMATTGATAETVAIEEQALVAFDKFIALVNQKNVENKKAHFKQVNSELETVAVQLVEKINEL